MNLNSLVPIVLTIMMALLAGSGQKTNGRWITPDDPFGLKGVGLGKPLVKYSLTRTDTPAPDRFVDCGQGVLYTTLGDKKVKETKVVILTFKPKPEEIYVPSLAEGRPGKREDAIYVPPSGYGSLSFQWPTELRASRPMRLQWTGLDDNGERVELTQTLGAEINLSEGENPAFEWRLDNYVSGERRGPLLFYITLPKGAKKCIGK